MGCAEGELIKITHSVFPDAAMFATDISADEIEKARSNCKTLQVDYSVQNAEQLMEYPDSAFDLVICCEVLEHLSNPGQGLSELCRISSKYILVSVPHEPIWRMLNMVRGKYFSACGNTPGHIQHWNKKKFIQFINSQPGLKIVSRIYPFPWQMLLLERVHA